MKKQKYHKPVQRKSDPLKRDVRVGGMDIHTHRLSDPLKRDVRPGDRAGHCGICNRDTYFRPRPPENLMRCIRCLARMTKVVS